MNKTVKCDPNYICSSPPSTYSLQLIKKYLINIYLSKVYSNNIMIKKLNIYANTLYCFFVFVWTVFNSQGEKSNPACFRCIYEYLMLLI
jgi:hypothetical protein